ncbi:MAG: ABC transporter permease, partial [Paludibacteraceae bacterium]|nr:ABC transporter permease [Paludibacteraceae bacterium]
MNKLLQIVSSRRTWAWPYVLFMALFVLLPLILVAVYAFTDIDGRFTLHNFAKFFSHSEAISTFLYSLMIAVFNTLICLLIGYPAAYIMA